jgi:hypothetical protein
MYAGERLPASGIDHAGNSAVTGLGSDLQGEDPLSKSREA